jgi:hypothetical protein
VAQNLGFVVGFSCRESAIFLDAIIGKNIIKALVFVVRNNTVETTSVVNGQVDAVVMERTSQSVRE